MYKTTVEQYDRVVGIMEEVKSRLLASESVYNPLLVEQALKEILDGNVSRFTHDKTSEGWTLLEDVGFSPAFRDINHLTLTRVVDYVDSCVSGHEMARRAVAGGGNFGQKHAEWFLEEERYRKTLSHYRIIFPGTKWRQPDGEVLVPAVFRGRLVWVRFDYVLYGNDPYGMVDYFLCLKK